MNRRQWPDLRRIQEDAARPILEAEQDVILAAATAGGKTEAAFFPILTSLAERTVVGSVGALCVSPLKALINDQFSRLEELGKEVGISVHRWHGDVSAGKKKRLLDHPSGILLITPESLEAFFVRRGPALRSIFGNLRFVVIDELHAFLGSERGRQLQSLLHRLELALGHRVPRIALSATLGDLGLAANFLRPAGGTQVLQVEDRDSRREIRLQIRGYRQKAASSSGPAAEGKGSPADPGEGEDLTGISKGGDVVHVARDLFDRLRGGHHLIFANRRSEVERYADLFRRLCEQAGVPNEFRPHHGSLSKELREDAERAINDRRRPTSLVATTTLELGIDVGAITSVAQIGAPPSVAALRQRLGRSGRKEGDPAVLRIAVQVPEVTPHTPLPRTLHPELLQAIAMVELLIAGWVEPPPPTSLHLSTLVQQVLSLLAQCGGAKAPEMFRALCRSGPFEGVSTQLFSNLLRSLGAKDLVIQDHSRELILGLRGEQVVDHYSFYAAFSSPEEYRLVAGRKTLGQLPISYPLFTGLLLVFAGRRWQVLEVDEEQKVIELRPAPGGRVPSFAGGDGPMVHDRVRDEMRALYTSDLIPRYLDTSARQLLVEARDWYGRHRLDSRRLVSDGKVTWLFPWAGDRILATLALLLARHGLSVSIGGFVLEIQESTAEEVLRVLSDLSARPLPPAADLARQAANKQREKFHIYLTEDLLAADYAAGCLDVEGTAELLPKLLG